MFPGNPGVAEFYIETMRSVQQQAEGKIHVYTAGHAYHGLVIDDDKMEAYNRTSTQDASQIHPQARNPGMSVQEDTDLSSLSLNNLSLPELPPFDGDRVPHGIPLLNDIPVNWVTEPKNDVVCSLREQIMFKLHCMCVLRARHPNSKFILAGNSMGGHLIMEVVRSVERMYVLKHYGEAELKRYDQLNKLDVADVETETDIGVQLEVPYFHAFMKDVKTEVTQVLFTPAELKQWMSLIDDCPAPTTIPPGPGETAGFNVRAATHWLVQTQMLMATVMRIVDTPNGSNFHLITKFMPLIRIGLACISALPGFVKRALSALNANPTTHPDVHACIRLLVNLQSMQNVVKLASHEMEEIRSLDTRLLLRNGEKIVFYMVDGDGWAPMVYTDYLDRLSEKWIKRGWPAHSVYVDQHGMQHAYMFGKSQEMGVEAYKFAASALEKNKLSS